MFEQKNKLHNIHICSTLRHMRDGKMMLDKQDLVIQHPQRP